MAALLEASRSTPMGTPMVEIETESLSGFAYGDASLSLLTIHGGLKYRIELSDCLASSATIYKLSFHSFPSTLQSLDLTRLGEILCEHGNAVNYKALNRLPQDGWQELIDCWSCHKSEFRSMLDLTARPREHGILVSNFFILPHDSVLPPCCKGKQKLYYNTIKTAYTTDQFIYVFFEEYFTNKNSIVIRDGPDRACEVRFFYKCLLMSSAHPEASAALKIGIRETEQLPIPEETVNDFYSSEIMARIRSNIIPDIEILGCRLSFITCDMPC